MYNPYVLWEGAIHFLNDPEIGILSPVYITWKPTPRIDPNFMDYLVRTKAMLNKFLELSAGAVQRRRAIKKYAFASIIVQVPPFQEQLEIAQIIKIVDSAIELTEHARANTERIKKGLMRQLLTLGIKHSEYKDTAIGKIPKEWKLTTIDEECSVGTGGTPLGKS